MGLLKMLRFNRKVKTKDGQTLIPFLMEKEIVYCFDSGRNTVVKHLSDFEEIITESKPEEPKTIMVSPLIEMEDRLFPEEQPSDDVIVEEIPSTDIITPKPVGDSVSEISNEEYI